MFFAPDKNIDQFSSYSPLALAFIGDAVYETYVRTRVLMESNASAATLHKRAARHVNAQAQAASLHALLDHLTDEEMAVYKRGRNAKSPTVPKNAKLTDYRTATGLEALFGYLYLKGDASRLDELMRLSFEAVSGSANADTKQQDNTGR